MATAIVPTLSPAHAEAVPAASRLRRLRIPISGCAALIALTLWNTLHKSVWTDEAYSLLTSHGSLARTWHQAVQFELQPPVYFVLLNAWLRLGGDSVEWGRAFSTVCVLGCVVVLWLCQRPMWRSRGIPVPILAAITATVVWAAAEMRDYGLVLFLSAMSYWLFLRLVTGRSRHPRRDAVLYGLVAYVSLLTMYYMGFVLLGQWVAALMARRARWLLTAALAAVGVAMLPWIPVILTQVSGHSNVNLSLAAEAAQTQLPGGAPAVLLRDLLGALFAASPTLDRPYVALVLAALLALVPLIRLAGVLRTRRQRITPAPSGVQWDADETALVVALGVSALTLVGLRVSNVTLVWPRHMAAVTPAFLLLWSLWTTRAPSVAAARIGCVAILLVCITTLASFERNIDVEDTRGAARYILLHAPTEPVLVIGPETVFSFRYYYRGQGHGTAPVYAVPHDASLQVYDPESVPLNDPAQIATRVSAAGVRRDFWIVVAKRFMWQSEPAHNALESFLRARTTVQDSTDFRNVYVLHAVLHA